MFTVTCPSCRKTLRIDQQGQAIKVRCPACKTVFTASPPDSSAPAATTDKPAAATRQASRHADSAHAYHAAPRARAPKWPVIIGLALGVPALAAVVVLMVMYLPENFAPQQSDRPQQVGAGATRPSTAANSARTEQGLTASQQDEPARPATYRPTQVQAGKDVKDSNVELGNVHVYVAQDTRDAHAAGVVNNLDASRTLLVVRLAMDIYQGPDGAKLLDSREVIVRCVPPKATIPFSTPVSRDDEKSAELLAKARIVEATWGDQQTYSRMVAPTNIDDSQMGKVSLNAQAGNASGKPLTNIRLYCTFAAPQTGLCPNTEADPVSFTGTSPVPPGGAIVFQGASFRVTLPKTYTDAHVRIAADIAR